MRLKPTELIRVNNVLYVNSFPANAHALQHLLGVYQSVILVYDLYVTLDVHKIQDIKVLRVLF